MKPKGNRFLALCVRPMKKEISKKNEKKIFMTGNLKRGTLKFTNYLILWIKSLLPGATYANALSLGPGPLFYALGFQLRRG